MDDTTKHAFNKPECDTPQTEYHHIQVYNFINLLTIKDMCIQPCALMLIPFEIPRNLESPSSRKLFKIDQFPGETILQVALQSNIKHPLYPFLPLSMSRRINFPSHFPSLWIVQINIQNSLTKHTAD